MFKLKSSYTLTHRGMLMNKFARCMVFIVFAAFFGAILLPSGIAEAAAKKGDYVGSETCGACHRAQHNDWVVSGHPYKLRKAEDAKKAGLPVPEGWSWNEISYVIGGRNWKTRYVDKKGFIITMTGPKKDKPGKNQFNLEDGTWSNYHPGEKNKPYNCGGCHTTGFSKEGHQDGLPGMIGTWTEPGVGCEACHGPGAKHVAAGGDKKLIKIDSDKSMCGQCHIRGKSDAIPASGGFIRHHEQYNEILASGHKVLNCTTCHKPHKHAKFKDAMKLACQTCHQKQTAEYAGSGMQLRGVACTDCHMPEATKSAIKKAKYKGDVMTHLFKINLDPNAKMFFQKGKKSFASGFLTVEYACLTCHGEKDRAWAIKTGKGVHSYGKK